MDTDYYSFQWIDGAAKLAKKRPNSIIILQKTLTVLTGKGFVIVLTRRIKIYFFNNFLACNTHSSAWICPGVSSKILLRSMASSASILAICSMVLMPKA